MILKKNDFLKTNKKPRPRKSLNIFSRLRNLRKVIFVNGSEVNSGDVDNGIPELYLPHIQIILSSDNPA